MIVVPDMAHGLARWLTGRAVDAGATPRFQAVPGPKPVLGLARIGPAPPFAMSDRRRLRLPDTGGLGLPRLCRPGHPGAWTRWRRTLRGCPRVFLAFDNDDAGREATANLQAQLGRRAAVVNLPQGVADVGELAALPHGQLLFRRLLARAARAARQ